jgi:hypothetical protein
MSTVVRLPLPIDPELRAQVERLKAGRTRLPGIPGTDDPGLVLAQVEARYHPGAQAEADALRARLARRADRKTIAQWLGVLATTVANPPASEEAFEARVSGIAFVCGDLPAEVWSRETLKAATGRYKFWPSAPELADEVLRPIADAMEREIAALDRIARADPATAGWPTGPARESTVPYNPVASTAPKIERRRSLRERGDDDFDREEAAKLDAEARKSMILQLARLGHTRETAGAIAKAPVGDEPVRKEKP